jgi:signal transduction histidine kinase
MATSLAQEIHNPLSAIRMHGQLLQSAPPEELPATAAAFIPTLLEETGRIEGLVNQWMFLTRPEPPSMSALSLEQIVSQAARGQSAAAAHAGVKVDIEVPEGLVIMGDRRRLGQAVTNVIVNAFQAMPRGGTLRIRAAGKEGFAVLALQDNGPGFSPQAFEKYRELFYSEKEGGMGIGLSVSAEIIEAHGGRLAVENAPGGGGLVTFQLPMAANSPPLHQ